MKVMIQAEGAPAGIKPEEAARIITSLNTLPFHVWIEQNGIRAQIKTGQIQSFIPERPLIINWAAYADHMGIPEDESLSNAPIEQSNIGRGGSLGGNPHFVWVNQWVNGSLKNWAIPARFVAEA